MPYTADAVANEFLSLWMPQGISPMKLQKLVYYAHGWHLAIADSPLINERIQAWKFGPVIQSLYREFKEFGNSSIDRLAREMKWLQNYDLEVCEPRISDEPGDATFPKALVARIWELYGNFTAGQLSTMTHESGSPWHTVVSKFPPGGMPSGLSIPDEIIKNYFKPRLAR